MRSRSLVLASLVVLFSAVSAYSQCKPISSLPVTLNQSGQWCVTADLIYSGAGAAISIATNNVTVDLGGFRVTSANTSSGVGVGGLNVNHVIIRNGSITAGYRGVEVNTSGAPPLNVIVENLEIDGFNNMGIYLAATQTTVHNCVVRAPAASTAWGIYAMGGDVDHVTVDGVSYGVYLNGGTFRTVRNSFISASSYCVVLYGWYGSVVNNEIHGNGTGIFAGNGSVIASIGNRIATASNPISNSSGASKYRDNIFLNNTTVLGGFNAGNNQ
jgi:hypothetical protein